MTNQKLTDNEIIKGFECCMRPPKCDECPFRIDPHNCKDVMEKSILNILNRQKEEIERLRANIIDDGDYEEPRIRLS